MISTRSLVPSAAALAVLIPATAKATIVPGKSISSVSVTATQDELVDELGNFSRKEVGEESADYGLFWTKRKFHALVIEATRRAILISTTSIAQRTASNVGPGVSERVARRRLRGERCSTIFDGDRRIDVTLCVLRSQGPDTSFTISRGRVIEVTIDSTE